MAGCWVVSFVCCDLSFYVFPLSLAISSVALCVSVDLFIFPCISLVHIFPWTMTCRLSICVCECGCVNGFGHFVISFFLSCVAFVVTFFCAFSECWIDVCVVFVGLLLVSCLCAFVVMHLFVHAVSCWFELCVLLCLDLAWCGLICVLHFLI